MNKINQIKWAEINLDALSHNLKEIRRLVGDEVKICAVVKANGYGHGAIEISQELIENGADMLGVSSINEAIELRKIHKKVQILVLGYMPDDFIEDAILNDVIQTVVSYEQALEISQVAEKMSMGASIHIKVDTGMHRIGIWYEDAPHIIEKIYHLPNIKINGIFSHFAVADISDKYFSYLQYNRFLNAIDALEKKHIKIPIKHIANSPATIDLHDTFMDMIRPGLLLYGIYPNEDENNGTLKLKPVMSLKTIVSFVKKMKIDSGISYGLNYEGKKNDVIATIPIGYADGFTRAVSNDYEVLVNGKRAKVVGNVCMDQCMLDVSSIENVKVGDEVTIFGDPVTGAFSVKDFAERADRINYEMLCSIGRRVPRVYVKNGEVVKITNYLV